MLPATACNFEGTGLAPDEDAPETETVDASSDKDGMATTPDAAIDGLPGCPDLAFVPSNLAPALGDATFAACDSWIVDSATMIDTGIEPAAWMHEGEVSVVAQGPGEPEVFVVRVGRFEIAEGVQLVVRGSRPLIIIAFEAALINGIVDVGATGQISGPGGGVATICGDGSGPQDGTGGSDLRANPDDGFGGGGGGFGTNGGEGGGDPLTRGGEPSAMATLVPLRGGCPGGRGGSTSAGASRGTGGIGGGGGGAIQVSAAAITIDGSIFSPGGGGQGAQPDTGSLNCGDAGGGGGGAGGAILLEGESVTIDPQSRLVANGGGGGAGCDATLGVAASGQDGERPGNDQTDGIGGAGQNGGGEGGDGDGVGPNSSGHDGQTAVATGSGSGGGGGGFGRIRINTPSGEMLCSGMTISGTCTVGQVSPRP